MLNTCGGRFSVPLGNPDRMEERLEDETEEREGGKRGRKQRKKRGNREKRGKRDGKIEKRVSLIILNQKE
jgi:hypothetical protein